MHIFSDSHQQKLDWTIMSVELYMFMTVLMASTYFEVYQGGKFYFLFVLNVSQQSVCSSCVHALWNLLVA